MLRLRTLRGRSGSPLPRLVVALLLILLLGGCDAAREAGLTATAPPLPTLMSTPTGSPPALPEPSDSPADSGWLQAALGVELRRLRVAVGEGLAPVSVVRLDPARIRLEVGYDPERPRPLAAWAEERAAVAAINGGFFDEQNRTVALLVHNGEQFGASYSGRGGMLAVAPDGTIRLRGLADEPYQPGEPIAEALQGWPLLIRPGGEVAYRYEDGERDRRSAVALDRSGRVLLIAAATPAFTLLELATWLARSDLAIDAAMNLDGGGSTGLIVPSATNPEQIDPFVTVPIVLLALPR